MKRSRIFIGSLIATLLVIGCAFLLAKPRYRTATEAEIRAHFDPILLVPPPGDRTGKARYARFAHTAFKVPHDLNAINALLDEGPLVLSDHSGAMLGFASFFASESRDRASRGEWQQATLSMQVALKIRSRARERCDGIVIFSLQVQDEEQVNSLVREVAEMQKAPKSFAEVCLRLIPDGGAEEDARVAIRADAQRMARVIPDPKRNFSFGHGTRAVPYAEGDYKDVTYNPILTADLVSAYFRTMVDNVGRDPVRYDARAEDAWVQAQERAKNPLADDHSVTQRWTQFRLLFEQNTMIRYFPVPIDGREIVENVVKLNADRKATRRALMKINDP